MAVPTAESVPSKPITRPVRSLLTVSPTSRVVLSGRGEADPSRLATLQAAGAPALLAAPSPATPLADPADDLRVPLKGPLRALRDGSSDLHRAALHLVKSAHLLPAALLPFMYAVLLYAVLRAWLQQCRTPSSCHHMVQLWQCHAVWLAVGGPAARFQRNAVVQPIPVRGWARR